MRNGSVGVESSRSRCRARLTHRRQALVVLAVGSVGLVAGCSDDSADSTTSLASSTAATTVSSTVATTTSSAAPTTTTTSVPATTTTTTTSTPPDTSGPAPPVSVVFPAGYHEMIAAFRQHETVLRECGRRPTECDFVALDAVVAPGDLRTAYHDGFGQAAASGLSAVPGAAPSYTVLEDVFTDENTGQVSGVAACRVDGDIAVRVNDPANPADDEVVDDSVASFKIRIGFELVDGAWMATGQAVDETLEGNICGPPDD